MAKRSTRYRIVRAVTLQTVLGAAVCGALGAWLFEVDRLHWTLTLASFGAVVGFLLSYVNVAIILRPSPRTVDIAFALLLPLTVLLALSFVAVLAGKTNMLFERDSLSLLGAALLVGILMFLKWSRQEQ